MGSIYPFKNEDKAEFLRAARISKGLSVSQMADLLCVKRNCVYLWESEKLEVSDIHFLAAITLFPNIRENVKELYFSAIENFHVLLKAPKKGRPFSKEHTPEEIPTPQVKDPPPSSKSEDKEYYSKKRLDARIARGEIFPVKAIDRE